MSRRESSRVRVTVVLHGHKILNMADCDKNLRNLLGAATF